MKTKLSKRTAIEPSSSDSPIQLVNEHVRFAFNRKNGDLVQIENRRTGVKYLNDDYGFRLFRILIPDEQWFSCHADSSRVLEPPEISRTGQTLRLKFSSLAVYDSAWSQGKLVAITAEVQVTLPADSAEAIFVLQLTNRSRYRIQEVWFPWIGGITGIAGPGKDFMVLNQQLRDIHKLFADPANKSYTLCRDGWTSYYPVPAAMHFPWTDLSGQKSGGLSYIRYMQQPAIMGLLVENLRYYQKELCLGMAWVNMPGIQPGATWESPPTGIAVHGEDWHSTADRFRTWCEGRFEPPKPPSSLVETIGMQVIETRSWDGFRTHSFQELPRLFKQCAKYGLTHFSIWDVVGQMYSRPEDAEVFQDCPESSHAELRPALRDLSANGCNSNTLINSRLLKLSSQFWKQWGEGMANRRPDGSGFTEYWTCSNFHSERMPGLHYGPQGTLCQRTPEYRNYVMSLVKRVMDLGFTSYFVDQAAEWFPCSNPDHRHASPDEISAFYDVLSLIREEVKSHGADSYVIAEVPHVNALPYVDLWWHWAQDNRSFFRYTCPDTLQLWVTSHDRGQMNYAFVMGLHICLVNDALARTIADYPESAAHLKKLSDLRKRCVQWTMRARFLDTVGLSAQRCAAYLYRTSDGLCVTFANQKNQPVEARIAIDGDRYPGPFALPGNVYRLDGKVLKAGKPNRRRIELQIKLAPYEVGVWVLDGREDSRSK